LEVCTWRIILHGTYLTYHPSDNEPGAKMNKSRLGILLVLLFGLTACENMTGVRQSFESLNKVLSPLAVLKKGSN
jgi:hypothetical protein